MLLHHTVALFLSTCVAQARSVPHPRDNPNRAVYFQDNDANSNQLISLKIDPSYGTLSSPVCISTGGEGLMGLIAVSQDSVIVSGDYIFTPNAGSNTLSLFKIKPEDPYHPTLLGTTQPTLGETPVSVTYSTKLKTACVANAGSTAGVTCFSVHPKRGLIPLGGLRPIAQTQLADPHPFPPIPLVLIADIIFNPSSTALFITVRSNGGLPGSIYVFPVKNGSVATTSVRTQFPDLPFAYSLNFLTNGGSKALGDTRMIVTNPAVNISGLALLDVSYPSLKITQTQLVDLPGHQATCWVAYDPRLSSSAYLMDATAAEIDIVNPGNGAVENRVTVTNGGVPAPRMTGPIDAKLDRDCLYFLTDDTAAPKINVFKYSGPSGADLQVAQQFDILSQVGKFLSSQGLAIYPAQMVS